MRLPNDPVAAAVVPQMAAPRKVSDDQDVQLSFALLLGSTVRDIAAIDDEFGVRSHVLRKLGNFFGGEADDLLLPHMVDGVADLRVQNPPSRSPITGCLSIGVYPRSLSRLDEHGDRTAGSGRLVYWNLKSSGMYECPAPPIVE